MIARSLEVLEKELEIYSKEVRAHVAERAQLVRELRKVNDLLYASNEPGNFKELPTVLDIRSISMPQTFRVEASDSAWIAEEHTDLYGYTTFRLVTVKNVSIYQDGVEKTSDSVEYDPVNITASYKGSESIDSARLIRGLAYEYEVISFAPLLVKRQRVKNCVAILDGSVYSFIAGMNQAFDKAVELAEARCRSRLASYVVLLYPIAVNVLARLLERNMLVAVPKKSERNELTNAFFKALISMGSEELLTLAGLMARLTDAEVTDILLGDRKHTALLVPIGESRTNVVKNSWQDFVSIAKQLYPMSELPEHLKRAREKFAVKRRMGNVDQELAEKLAQVLEGGQCIYFVGVDGRPRKVELYAPMWVLAYIWYASVCNSASIVPVEECDRSAKSYLGLLGSQGWIQLPSYR